MNFHYSVGKVNLQKVTILCAFLQNNNYDMIGYKKNTLTLFCVVLIMFLLSACQNNPETAGASENSEVSKESAENKVTPANELGSDLSQGNELEDNSTEVQVQADLKNVRSKDNESLSTYLSDVELQALSKLQTNFEDGLLNTYKKTKLEQAYEFLALGFRKEILDQEGGRIQAIYPFNGGYDQSFFQALAGDFEFMTKACGFQLPDGTVYNYYCLKAESTWMDFYLGNQNSFIESLLTQYQTNKSFDSAYKESLLISALDELDFSKDSDRIFFYLNLLLIQEEFLAYGLARQTN